MADYSTYSAEELLDALEQAGRIPDLELIRTCLERQEEITPGLLRLLRKMLEDEWEEWDDDDPRHYREVHAGLLLIAFREEDALPTFQAYLREDEYENLLEWFESELPAYGPVAVPTFRDLLYDASAWSWGRVAAGEILSTIAFNHPSERERVVTALRDQLPPPDAVGAQEEDEDQVIFWTFIAYGLARLGDERSREQVLALYEHDLIDVSVFGDEEEYEAILEAEPEAKDFLTPPPSLIEFYEQLDRAERRSAEWRAAEAARTPSETFTHEGKKIGRNERVTVQDPKTGETQVLKYKHAQKKLDKGWRLLT